VAQLARYWAILLGSGRTVRGEPLLSVFRQGGICRALAPALCWALLFRVLIPLSHIPLTQPGVDWRAAEEWASFCHGDGGPLDIPPDRDREPGNQAPIGKHPFCPICLAAHLAGTLHAAGSRHNPVSCNYSGKPRSSRLSDRFGRNLPHARTTSGSAFDRYIASRRLRPVNFRR